MGCVYESVSQCGKAGKDGGVATFLIRGSSHLSHWYGMGRLLQIGRTMPAGQLARRHGVCAHNAIGGLCLVLDPIVRECMTSPFADTFCELTRTGCLRGRRMRRDQRANVNGAIGHSRQTGRRGVQGHGVKYGLTCIRPMGHSWIPGSKEL